MLLCMCTLSVALSLLHYIYSAFSFTFLTLVYFVSLFLLFKKSPAGSHLHLPAATVEPMQGGQKKGVFYSVEG